MGLQIGQIDLRTVRRRHLCRAGEILLIRIFAEQIRGLLQDFGRRLQPRGEGCVPMLLETLRVLAEPPHLGADAAAQSTAHPSQLD